MLARSEKFNGVETIAHSTVVARVRNGLILLILFLIENLEISRKTSKNLIYRVLKKVCLISNTFSQSISKSVPEVWKVIFIYST